MMKRMAVLVGLIWVFAFGASVAQAATLDLTAATAPLGTVISSDDDSGFINGAYFQWTNISTTGTGVIDPFLRIQKGTTEQGYNTDGSVQFDAKSGIFTHSITLRDLPILNLGGTNYYEILLDINENNNTAGHLLSLDEFQVFINSSSGSIDTVNDVASLSDLGTQAFDLDSGVDGDSKVLLNFSLNPGSGAGDVFIYLPTSLFTSYSNSDFVYVYALLGGTGVTTTPPAGDYGSDDGFEEFAVRLGVNPPPPPPVIPEPTSLLLMGSGLIGALGFGTSRKRQV